MSNLVEEISRRRTFAIETKSNFVLIGEENAIDDAL